MGRSGVYRWKTTLSFQEKGVYRKWQLALLQLPQYTNKREPFWPMEGTSSRWSILQEESLTNLLNMTHNYIGLVGRDAACKFYNPRRALFVLLPMPQFFSRLLTRRHFSNYAQVVTHILTPSSSSSKSSMAWLFGYNKKLSLLRTHIVVSDHTKIYGTTLSIPMDLMATTHPFLTDWRAEEIILYHPTRYGSIENISIKRCSLQIAAATSSQHKLLKIKIEFVVPRPDVHQIICLRLLAYVSCNFLPSPTRSRG